jgi:hypothetical protein
MPGGIRAFLSTLRARQQRNRPRRCGRQLQLRNVPGAVKLRSGDRRVDVATGDGLSAAPKLLAGGIDTAPHCSQGRTRAAELVAQIPRAGGEPGASEDRPERAVDGPPFLRPPE